MRFQSPNYRPRHSTRLCPGPAPVYPSHLALISSSQTLFDTKEDDKVPLNFRDITRHGSTFKLQGSLQAKTRGIRPGSRYVVQSNSYPLSYNDAKRVLCDFVWVCGIPGEQVRLTWVILSLMGAYGLVDSKSMGLTN